MIKINLLPFRAARKQENIRRQISVYVLSVIFILLLSGYAWWHYSSKLSRLKAEKIQKTKELATYAETTKKIKAIKIKIAQIEAKLKVIRGLEEKKTGPVLLLDEISAAVPKDRVWLSALSDKNGILSLKGTARDNDTVALFMTNLEKAAHIKSVDLNSTALKVLKAQNLNLTNFALTCKTYAYKEKAKPKPKRGRGKRR